MSVFVIPYNVKGRTWTDVRREAKNRVFLFRELGGTAYEVAEQSGFIDAYEFWNTHALYDDEEDSRSMVKKWILAVEAYVHRKDEDAYERMFLYTDWSPDEKELLDHGKIRQGRLLLSDEAFQKLQEKGFHAISAQSRHPWSSDYTFSGNGYNRVLLAETAYHERVYIQPDLYAVDACMAVIEKENMIRERLDPAFSIERINFADEAVIKELHPGNKGVFLCENVWNPDDFPDCYQRLAYQTAYLKHYYSDIEEKEPLQCKCKRNIKERILGIDLDAVTSYGAYAVPDRKLSFVNNQILGNKYQPAEYFAVFEGFGDILNAGVAISRMGLIIQRMMNDVRWGYEGTVDRTVITLPAHLPKREEIMDAMQRLQTEAGDDREYDLQVYREMEAEGLDGPEMIRKAAELAGAYPVTFIRKSEAIGYAYEYFYGESAFAEDALILVYDWNQTSFTASVLKRSQEGFSLCAEESMDSGTAQMNEMLLEDMERVLCNDGRLAACRVSKEDERWKNDWADFESQLPRMKNQLARCAKATLVFDLKWLKKTDEYPWERFEPTFASYYDKTKALVKKVMADTGVGWKGFSHVLLAGDWTKFPYVWSQLEVLTGTKVSQMKEPFLVAAYGAVNSVWK